MTRQEWIEWASRGAVLLDGATGSNLRESGIPVGVSPELWVLEHPEALLALQRGYVEAGSQILCAATFSANRLGLANFGLAEKVGELNAALVALSKEAAGGKALVAGDLSTVGRPLEPVGDLPYSVAYDIYREQMEALAAAGVDLLAVETLMGVDEAVAALDAAADLGLPVWCSFSVEAGMPGRRQRRRRRWARLPWASTVRWARTSWRPWCALCAQRCRSRSSPSRMRACR